MPKAIKTPDAPKKLNIPPEHRGGVCKCLKKHQKIVRYYLGYGFCLFCGCLTRRKMLGTRIR